MLGNQLTDPHQYHRTSGQRQQDRESFQPVRTKEAEGIGIENTHAHKERCLSQRLQKGQRYGEDTRDLAEAQASYFTLLRQVM